MFEDINAGNYVLSEKTVSLGGFGRGRYFSVKAKVEKATKTQLTVDGKRYMRSTGREVGASYGFSRNVNYIYPINNSLNRTDQTEEYLSFKEKMRKVKLIHQIANQLLEGVGHKTTNVDEIHDAMVKVVESIHTE